MKKILMMMILISIMQLMLTAFIAVSINKDRDKPEIIEAVQVTI